MRDSHDRDFPHQRKPSNDLLHFSGINQQSGKVDHAAGPSGEEKVSILRHPPKIAGGEAIADGRGDPLGSFEVGSREGRAPDNHFTDLARIKKLSMRVHDLDGSVAKRAADRAPKSYIPLEACADGARFGRAMILGYPSAKPLSELVPCVTEQGSPCSKAQPGRRKAW